MKKGITVLIQSEPVAEDMELPILGQINSGRWYPPNSFNYGGATLDPTDPANDDPNHTYAFPKARVVTGVSIYSEAPGVGETTTITVFKNGTATSVVAVLSGTNTFAANLAASVAFAAGDLVAVQIVKSGGSSSVVFNASIICM